MDNHLLLKGPDAHTAAYERQMGRCWACGDMVRRDTAEAHHRQSRKYLGFCLCNVVLLHARCHTQGRGDVWAVHDHPEWARERGLIVPSWADPREVPVLVPRGDGWEALTLGCSGNIGALTLG